MALAVDGEGQAKEPKERKGGRQIKTREFQIGLLAILVALLFQCAPGPQVIREKEEDVLRRRVQEYWAYEVKGQWDRAYPFEAPEYREKVDLVSYLKQKDRNFQKWETFEILEIWTVNDEANVRLNVKYRYLISDFRKGVFERVVQEKWIKRNNQWYHGL